MDTEQIIAVINMLQKQFDIVDNTWTYFALVSIGVLGFVVNSPQVVNSVLRLAIFQVGYIAFCAGNWLKLSGSYSTLRVLSKQTFECDPGIMFCAVAKSFASGVFSAERLVTFYSSMVLIVVVGIYITYKKNKKEFLDG